MDSDGVAKAVVWRSCLQVFYPDLTMDLGVEEYEEGSDSGDPSPLPPSPVNQMDLSIYIPCFP